MPMRPAIVPPRISFFFTILLAGGQSWGQSDNSDDDDLGFVPALHLSGEYRIHAPPVPRAVEFQAGSSASRALLNLPCSG